MSVEDAIEEIQAWHQLQAIEPEFRTVDRELLIRAVTAAEDAVEFIYESLARHDSDLGRSLKRHKEAAAYMERRIAEAKATVNQLRVVIGWPEREWKA